MKTYDLILFQEVDNPEDIAMMYPVEGGKWVKAEEAQESIDFLVEALKNLRGHTISRETTGALNDYITRVLEGY